MKIKKRVCSSFYTVMHSEKNDDTWHDIGVRQDRYRRAKNTMLTYSKAHPDEDVKIVKIVMYDCEEFHRKAQRFGAMNVKTGRMARYLDGSMIIVTDLGELAEIIASYHRRSEWRLIIMYGEKGSSKNNATEDEQKEFNKYLKFEFSKRESEE